MTNQSEMFRKRSLGRRVLLILAVAMLLLAAIAAGCKGDKQEGASAAVKKKVQPASTESTPKQDLQPAAGKQEARTDAAQGLPGAEAPPEGGESEPAVTPKKIRDPFQSFVRIGTEKARTRDAPVKILTPLQKYSLDQLRVVGVIEGPDLRKALLEDDLGKGYVVGTGDLIGNQGGRIAAIESDRIIIEESVTDVMGVERKRRVTKKLYTPEQERQR